MANADLKLLLAANVSESTRQINKDIDKISKNLSNKPINIKLAIDTNDISQTIAKQIPQISKQLNKAFTQSIPITVQFSTKNPDLNTVKKNLKAQLSDLYKEFDQSGKMSDEFKQHVTELKRAISSLSDANGISKLKEELKGLSAELKNADISKYANMLPKLDILKNQAIKYGIDINGFDELNQAYRLLNQINSTDGSFNNLIHSDQVALLKEFNTTLDAVNTKIKSVKAQEPRIDNDYIDNLGSTLNSYKNKALQYRIDVEGWEELKSAYDILNKIQAKDGSFAKLTTEEQVRTVRELESAIAGVQGRLRDISSQNTSERSLASTNAAINKLTRDVQKFGTEYQKIFNDPNLSAKYSELISGLSNPDNFNAAGISKLRDEFAAFKTEAEAAGATTKSLGQWLSEAYQKFGGWALVTSSMMQAVRTLQQMVEAVRQLDSAMTELKKVTDETNATYEKFFANAAQKATEIGTTMSNYISSTADFARLGYSLSDAETLANTASIYFNVADGIETIDEASQSVISTMKAFDVQVEDSMSIVDLFNETSNNFAISSGGIGEAMQRSASALKAAGNTMEESVALITAANTVVQDPLKVGNALKTLSLRIRGAKVELEEAGESTEGMANSVSELRKEILALTGQKVDIMLDDDTFKSTYQILQEMSQVWNSMTDINQAAALELLGGKEQANILSSLLQNFSTAEDVITTSQGAAGSALAENEKQLDSINGKINQFKANFEALSASMIDSDLTKGVIGIGSDTLSGLTDLINTLGALPTLLATISAGFAGFKTVGIFTSEQQANAQNYISYLSQIKDYIVDFNGSNRIGKAQSILSVDTKELKYAVSIFENLKATSGDSFDAEQAKTDAISKAFKNASQSAKDFANSNDLSSESVVKFVQGQQQAIGVMQKTTLASKAAAVGMGLLNAAMTGLAVAGVSFVINSITQWIDDFIHKQDIAAEKVQQFANEFESLQTELQSLQSELDGVNQRIAELQSKGTLIPTEADELQRLKEQNAELQRSIELKKILAEQSASAASQEAMSYFGSSAFYDQNVTGSWVKDFGTPIEEAQAYMSKIDELNAELAEAKERQAQYADNLGVTSTEYQSVTGYIGELEGKISTYNQALIQLVSDMDTYAQQLDTSTEAGRRQKLAVDALIATYAQLSGGDGIGQLMSGSFGTDDQQLQKLAEQDKLTRDSVTQNQELVWTLTQVGITVDEVVEYYNALAEAQKSTAAPPNIDTSTLEGLKSALSDIVDQADAVSSMDLSSANLASGTDLQQEAWRNLQELAQETGYTIEELIEKMVEFGLVSGDGAGLLSDEFIAANSNASTFAQNLSNVQTRMNALSSAFKTLNDGQRLSGDTVQELLNYYPQLESELLEYLAGLRSQSQIMADLEEVYQIDLTNWKALVLAKMADNEDFYSNTIANNAELINEFNSQYGVDLSNCKTYAQAKLAVYQSIMQGALATARIESGMGNMQGPLTLSDTLPYIEQAMADVEAAMDRLNNVSFSGIEGQFDSLQSSIQDTKNAADEAAQALQSIASTSLSAINGLVDVTVSMLKQGLQNTKDQIEQELEDLKNQYDAAKDQLEADKKAALASLDAQKKALQAQKKAQDAAYDREIDRLNDLKDAQNDIYDDRIQAAEDELDAYNKIIDAQLKLLRLKEEQHDYERELADKQKDIADLEAQLAELGLDDSIEAQKKRLELEEELAAKREELEEFQHDKNVSDQEQALEDEKEAFNDKQQAIIDGIQAEKDAYNEMIDAKIEAIRREKEAFDENISAQIDAIEAEKTATQEYYDNALANLQRNHEAKLAAKEEEKEAVEKQIQDETELRKQAIALIQEKSDEFYNKLIEWNRKYGTGIDADIIVKWNNAYMALETFGGKQYDVLAVMEDLTFATNQFNTQLEEAVQKAGNLASALQGVLDKQESVLDLPSNYPSHGASPGGKPNYQFSAGRFHEGGEVGKDNKISGKDFNQFMDNLKSDEIPAILRLKEWVLTEEQQSDIMQLASAQKETIMAFSRLMGDLSTAMTSSSIPSLNNIMSQTTIPSLPDLMTASSGDQPISIQINTEITGNADDNVMDKWFAKNTAAFQDRFARYTLDQINYKRGLRTYR